VSGLCVECAPDSGGREVPVRFGVAGAMHEVVEIVDRWYGRDHRYFRIRTRDGAQFILRYDEGRVRWGVTFFESGPAPSDEGAGA
jgi:hypothetical protein